MVRIVGSHPTDPGSNPGEGTFLARRARAPIDRSQVGSDSIGGQSLPCPPLLSCVNLGPGGTRARGQSLSSPHCANRRYRLALGPDPRGGRGSPVRHGQSQRMPPPNLRIESPKSRDGIPQISGSNPLSNWQSYCLIHCGVPLPWNLPDSMSFVARS